MKLTLRKFTGIIICVLLIVITVTWFFLQQRTVPVTLITVPVRTGNIENTVLAAGKLDAIERVNVGAQVTGQVKNLTVKTGDRVTKGQLIADIDDLQQKNNLRIAEAELDQAKADKIAKDAQLRRAELKFKRQRNMLRDDSGSREEFESAETTLATTRADILSLQSRIVKAQIEVDKKKLELSYTRVTAPMDGMVIAVVTRQGQTVNAEQSAPTIVKIAQLDTMTVHTQISEADITRVYPGQKAWFTIFSEPDHRYEAILRMVEPAPDSVLKEDNSNSGGTPGNASVYYSALLDVPNPENRLRIAMTAQVSLLISEAKNVLLIPAAAVTTTADNRQEVLVINASGIPEPRDISTGITNNIDIQILSGLREGEEVVIPQTVIPQTGDSTL
ncbi:efflux RND transporter periplasmic adaptor subunit [Morganella psychrotolerans]|uniref:Efflux transporter periplasmic adaptor subunit n=1 Tax=Morganella psychrotolerans TaxID=368603 RepID=A0A1B8H5A4_9GAMM|nr:efflux RND transporter periplasmic adaptor subunit [Morganella psychrotolerans]OBU04257.1 efflux transporter periplasmic adaptor subunit [Morganella psychrotolerans]